MALNPFAPLPEETVTPRQLAPHMADVVRDRDLVRTPVNATWPCRCVRCNADVPSADRELALWWTPTWVWWLLPALGVWGLAVALMGKRVRVRVGLCDACARRHRNLLAAFVGMLAVGVTVGCAGADEPGFFRAGALITLVGVAGLIVGPKIARPSLVIGDLAWVRVGPAFTESLPASTGGDREVAMLEGESEPTLD